MTADQIMEWGSACMVTSSGHCHCQTCRKGQRGNTECRLAYPRATCTQSNARVITGARVNNSMYPRSTPANILPVVEVPRAQLVESLENRMHRLAIPGNDRRLLDYPLLAGNC